MTLTFIENLLQNFSFAILLFSTIYFWIQLAYFDNLIGQKITFITMVGSNLSLFLLLLFRWWTSSHFPLSNLYESLIFLSWSLTCTFFFLQNNRLIPVIISPLALLIDSFASFCLPEELQKASPLVPALQSNWLMMHVTVMVLSYAALLSGSIFSIAFLVFLKFQFKNSLFLAKSLDDLSYRTLGIGFPLLTIGILSGAVWANESWGSYWSWDPKETWALITWFVFAIYLHTRITKGWEGEKPALIATFGFTVVWICYLGVNLFGKGLHSYGWLQIN